MSCQSFEPWLLAEIDLTPEQEASLQSHLATCQECRRIRAGWQAARQELERPRMAQPAPGFSERFSASLAVRRARQAHLRQIRNLILGLSLCLIVCAIVLVGLIFSATSPVDILVRINGGIVKTIAWWNQAEAVLLVALQQPAILVIWILLTSGISLVAVGWLFSLWRISLHGGQV